MSTIDEVLATMSEEDATQTVDEVLVIDPNTRQINLPGSELIFGVESDTHSERKYFRCPRIVGNNLDLSSCFIRVNYRNANGEVDAYLVDDVAIVGDEISFSWKLSAKVTQYMGQVKFVVCACRPGGNGADAVEWNTTQATGIVLVGLEPDVDGIVDETGDAVSQLLATVGSQTAAVQSVGAEQVASVKAEGATQVSAVQTAASASKTSAMAEIEAKGTNTLDSIPDDYTELSGVVEGLARSTAPAIVCEAEGETVVVDDASNLSLAGLRVFGKTTQVTTTGKNLLDTNNMATFLNNQSKEKTGVVVPIEMDGVYTYYIADSTTVYVGYADSLDVAATHYTSALKDKPATGTISLKAGQYFLLWFDTGVTVRDSAGYSLAFGTEVTHEPYSGGKPSPSPDFPQELVDLEPMVTVTGKNLFDIESLRVTLQSDGSYLLPAYPKKQMIVFPNGYAGQMTVSGWIKYESADNRGGYIMVQYTDGTDDRVGVINSSLDYQRYELTTRADKVIAEIGVSYGVGTVTTYFKDVQVEFGTTATVYEPYAGQTVELTHSLPGIPVTSGGNYTDSDGQQWICDEVNLERGVYVQRVNRLTISPTNPKTFIGSDNFVYYPMGNYGVYGTRVYCSHYDNVGFNSTGASAKFGGFATVDEFNAFVMNNSVEVIYILATPIETTLSETEIAAYRALHTNKPNTTVLNDSGAHMVVKYAADTKLYIDNKIAALLGGK